MILQSEAEVYAEMLVSRLKGKNDHVEIVVNMCFKTYTALTGLFIICFVQESWAGGGARW